MFSLFKKKSADTAIKLKLSGLHCSACSLSIDDELESTPGVLSSRTHYAKQESIINYDPTIIDPSRFAPIIEKLGYHVVK